MEDLDQPLRLPRLDRWLTRSGRGLPGLTVEGAVLVDRRLRIRRRAAVVAIGIGAPAIVPAVMPSGRYADLWGAVMVVLFAAAMLVWTVLVRVGEGRLATTLPRRVSRDAAMPVWRQLGLLRSANCVIGVVAGGAFLAALIVMHAGIALIALFAGLFVVVATLCGIALWELVHAPALAVDEGSLPADRRLRRQSVPFVALPLVMAVVSIGAEIDLFGADVRWHFEALVEWAWLLYMAFMVIDAVARQLEQRDASPPPRRRRLGRPFA